MFERGDIVKVYFSLPYQKEHKSHPAIIVSNDHVYDSEESYVCVMITHYEGRDIFTFEIENHMLENPNLKEFSQARLHLVSFVEEKHFEKRPINKMKSDYVDNLVTHLYDKVLNI